MLFFVYINDQTTVTAPNDSMLNDSMPNYNYPNYLPTLIKMNIMITFATDMLMKEA